MEKDIQEILLTEEQIKTRIAELGKELTADYAGKDPIIVGVLKGVVVFSSSGKLSNTPSNLTEERDSYNASGVIAIPV